MVVIGSAGFGLTAILNHNKSLSAKTTQQAEINRATEFISNEIRRAVNIETNATNAFNDVAASISADKKNNARSILALDIPGIGDEVIYYVADANASWIGPKVIYRYGPSFNASGEYDTSNWTVEPLVDRIDERAINIACSNGGTPTSDTGVRGFYACVGSEGKMAQIYLNAKAEEGNESYGANIQVFSRAEDAPTLAAVPAAFSSTVLPFNISNGSLTLNRPANVTVEVLGNATRCDGSESTIPITIELIVDGSAVEQTLDTGESMTLPTGAVRTLVLRATGTGNQETYGCDYNFTTSSTDSTQVYTAFNRQDVSHIAALSDSSTIESFLQPYIVNGRVTLQDNQILYLFEMEASSKLNSSYDLQDRAVLVTID